MAMHTIQGSDPQPPITAVEGKSVEMELDTGATVTVMSEKVFRKMFPNLQQR